MRLLHFSPNIFDHGCFDLNEPLVDVAPCQCGVDLGCEFDILPLGAVHTKNVLHILEVKLLNAFEALFQMWLHLCWVLGLRQYFEKLFAAEEEESRKAESLGLQVSIQPTLHNFEVTIAFLQFL